MAASPSIFWYINENDGPAPWWQEGRTVLNPDALRHLAHGLDRMGFDGALLTGLEVFTLSADLISATEHFRFLIPVYPGLIPPALLADKARAFNLLSNRRLIINQVNGDRGILNRYGLFLDHDERYAASIEYWDCFRRAYSGDPSAYESRFFRYGEEDPRIAGLPARHPSHPPTPVWGSGASPAGIDHAGQVLDRYLVLLEHPDKMKRKIDAARAVAARHGRTLRAGLLGSVIVRETEEEAWAAAETLLRNTGVDTIVNFINGGLQSYDGAPEGQTLATLRSDGRQNQARIDALNAGRIPSRDALEIYPNIWNGIALWSSIDVRDSGWGTYLVGSARQVAERIRELQDRLDLDVFILSGWPLLQEAEITSRLLFPLLGIEGAAPRPAPILADVRHA